VGDDFRRVNAWRDRFAVVPYPDKSGTWALRYYQEIACESGAGEDRPRAAAHPTHACDRHRQDVHRLPKSRGSFFKRGGTSPIGKRSASQPAGRAFCSRRPNTLATQAYNDFTSFAAFADDALVRVKAGGHPERRARCQRTRDLLHDLPDLHERPPKDGEPSPYFGEYPPDFFDLSSSTSAIAAVRKTKAHGEAFSNTLRRPCSSASPHPKRKDNVDTYAYFGETGFVYSLKEGINDRLSYAFPAEADFHHLDEYVYTPDDRVMEERSKQESANTEADFNRIIEIKERERKRVEIFMSEINQKEKTLVFCATQASRRWRCGDLINQLSKTSTARTNCHRVAADDVPGATNGLREFRITKRRFPTILTSRKKLSTGAGRA